MIIYHQFERLFQFYQKTEDLMFTISAEEIPFQLGLSKMDLRKMLKSSLSGVDKSIATMYKKLQKNLTSEELLLSLWDKCKKEFLDKYGSFAQLVAKIYPTETIPSVYDANQLVNMHGQTTIPIIFVFTGFHFPDAKKTEKGFQAKRSTPLRYCSILGFPVSFRVSFIFSMADLDVDDAYDDYFYHDDPDDDLHPLQGRDSQGDDHDDGDDDNALEEDESDDLPTFRQNYTVLTEADIRRRVTDTIAEVSSVLSLSRIEAGILLPRYNWSASNVFDAWFTDEKLAREKAGLFLKPLIELPDHGDSILCEICFEYYPCDGLKSTSCGHPYCNDCWTSYIKIAIADGPQSLLLKCPHPSCHAAVGEDMVGLFASAQENKKYSGYFVMSYIESNKMIKWCPGPGCENSIHFVAGSENFSVTCLCSHSFCWNCTEEAHRPVDCETVTKWMLQNSSESENVNYILAFTKPCPKCKRPIEKNMGCSHMTCRDPCYFEFCWLCLKDWRNHGLCNRFEGNPEEEKRERAKKYMMKYTHYFERWATNKKSMIKAADDLQNVQSEQTEIVRRIQEKSAAEISFIPEACQQIIECRRVLAWTYAYGFYLPDECEAKRNLFEYLQGQAESGLERLHDCAEKELLAFLKQKRSMMEFIEFRKKLTLLTGVTRKFFDNLVTALQNGLSDVNSEGSSSVPKKRKMIRTAAALTGAPDFNTNINTTTATATATTTATATAIAIAIAMEPWACAYCSFENEGSSTFCTVCGRGSRT